MSKNQNYLKAAEYIKSADALLFTSGAGMGVDSGLPDFRGNEGFWKAYPPIAKLGVSFIEMANPKWFYEEPRLAWAFYGHRFNLYRRTVPHKGYKQLLEMGEAASEGYFVFTSNVDGQYQKAGYKPDSIAEIHGSIHHFQCLDCCTDEIWEADVDMIDVDEAVFAASKPFPACPHCGGIARPNILMFGDWGWLHQRSTAQERALTNFFDGLYKYHKIVIIETGAGTGLPTVRRFSESMSRKYEAPLIRINPRETNLGRSHESSLAFSEGAASGIDKIYTEYKKL
jgi:NAD-dependent SIR2 family protein deacetylase